MKLEQLEARLGEIDKAINNTSVQLNVLYGHQAELKYQIDWLKKELETQVEVPVE
jgi:hypothetical protein